MTNRIVCFDIETTGFSWSNGERIIEIGAVEIIDGVITDNKFHSYVSNQGRPIPKESYDVHKLSESFLSDKPKFDEIANDLMNFIGTSPVVAHNGIDFDFPFLNYELKQIGINGIPNEQQLDSLLLARNRVFGPKSYSLDSLAQWFGVNLSARADAHGALIDALILAEVYLFLNQATDQKSIKQVIEESQIKLSGLPRQNRQIRTFTLSDDELKNHSEFIEKNINDALWHD